MIPTELRIGNFVHYKDEKLFFEVRAVCKDRVHPINLIEHDNGTIYNVDLECINDLHPIILSPEILTKCGLTKFNNAWVLPTHSATDMMHFHFSVWDCGDDVNYHYNSAEFPIYLTSVHQLQNLYFALTGKELKIDTP